MKKVNLVSPKSRLIVILHPNTERADIVLTDRFFNKEEYSFSRKKAPTGNEERLLKRLGNLWGIKEAKTSKQELSLELIPGFEPKEWVGNVIELVKEFGGEDYNPEICVQNRRWAIRPETVYDNDGWGREIAPGVRETGIDVGVPFTAVDYQ